MKKSIVFSITAAIALALVFTACGSGNRRSEVDIGGEAVSVTGVSLNRTTLSLNIGAQETLVATVRPGNSTNKTTTWSRHRQGRDMAEQR